MDESKIAVMVAWPQPTNISELHGYYQKFIQNYGIIARPLTNLLKKGKFGWHEEAEVAFLALKQTMTTTPTLAILNFNETFTIKTDASREGIGVVLSQQGKPMAYMSRALGVTKQSWSHILKRCWLLWRPYVCGGLTF